MKAGIVSMIFNARLKIYFAFGFSCWFGLAHLFAVQEMNVDVCVYGGTSGGVIAAVQAARMGKSVALVALNNHLGGMTTSGLGWTDIGHVDNNSGDYIQGVSREFYNRIGQKYGLATNKWTFEPHVAETVFNDMVRQAGVIVFTNQHLLTVIKQGPRIIAAEMAGGNIFQAKMFIDASYEGDLMAKAGVTYTIGREAINTYGESLNGIQPPNSDFTGYNIDPYIVPGNPASGLLPLLQSGSPGTPGKADQRVQAYNFRLCLTTVVSNKVAITAPSGYTPNQFELLARYIQALVSAGDSPTLSTFLTVSSMPNGKIDLNNAGALSTDFVGESLPYVEANDSTRSQIWDAHRNYQQGFLYFLATDPRVPASVRNSMLNYGFCKDEFADNGGWPYEIYVREGRRMISDYVMTQSNIYNQLNVSDSIGMGGYFTDSHYLQRVVINGQPRNEGNSRGDITVPYPISYRAIIPKADECSNLLVPWSLSSSHTAFSSIRMEPVFMILGQSAGTAACFAIDQHTNVQNIDVPALQAQLMADNQALSMSVTNGTITLDDADGSGVTIVGSWTNSTASSGYFGSGYLHDGNANKGSDSITFRPNLSTGGSYQVFARWTSNANRATNVPYDIIYPGGTNTVIVDQTQRGGQWVWLMTTNFNSGLGAAVRIRNTGTTGFVIADAVEFVPNLPTVELWATDSQASRYGPRTGSFTIRRTGITNSSVVVSYSIEGDATNGIDYQSLGNAVAMPAGMVSTNIIIAPKTNSLPVGARNAKFTLVPDPNYAIGSLTSACVTIEDSPLNNWRLQYFGINATNFAVAGDSANPAGDGISNLIKYALGLNPTNAVRGTLFSFGVDRNGYFAISYTRPDPAPMDVSYRVSSSENLLAWCTNSSCVLTSSITINTNGTATVTTEGDTPVQSSSNAFLRLEVFRK